jgi:F0F1-type ATP synthase assembly protein I
VLGPVLMALIGLVIDRWLGTGPLFVLLFTLWGAAGAGIGLYYRYRRQMAETAAASAARAAGGPSATRGEAVS